ncbi:MAG: HIT domain-containing protein [Proteobacteria bacterium]|nr:HIT domain-containing protein [Pseudomonadota bacterium]
MSFVKQLWAPWRMVFIQGGTKTNSGCVFCELPRENQDAQNLILFKSAHSFVILNKYPYNNGHLMVIPHKHTADLNALSPAEHTDLISLTNHCVSALKESYKPEGFNIGMNLGAAGGAGIREHLHFHIVPRWTGDTNFMPVLADTKSMPQHLTESFKQLEPYFRRLS